MGYFVLVFAFVSQKRRLLISLTGLFLGSGIGLYRIAQGAHFLSDVIFSALLVYAIAWLLDRLLPLLISEPHAAQSAWLPSVLGMVHTKPN
jgi:lipid A 4'-phosphatase